MSNALRARALRLLARREHSCQELAGKLARHAESAAQLDSLLDSLRAASLLSDERYSELRIEARAGRWGDARLAAELRMKGVSEEIVSAALESAGDELTRAQRVSDRHFARRSDERMDEHQLARQARFLAGRGFSVETIRHLLANRLKEE